MTYFILYHVIQCFAYQESMCLYIYTNIQKNVSDIGFLFSQSQPAPSKDEMKDLSVLALHDASSSCGASAAPARLPWILEPWPGTLMVSGANTVIGDHMVVTCGCIYYHDFHGYHQPSYREVLACVDRVFL